MAAKAQSFSPAASILLLPALLWLLLYNQVKWDWQVIPQYSYGWVVPILGAYMIWNRWQYRPAGDASGGHGSWILGGILLLALLPSRMIQEVNTDWRLVIWMLTGQIVLLTLIVFYQAGGWIWVRHFTFVTLFLVIAVPWPNAIEQPLVQDMMRLVTIVVTELLNSCHIPALPKGNLIELSTGLVGVEEACSGIQSFQAAVMVALFLGELFTMPVLRRCGLLIISASWAFVCNCLRTFFLAWMAHHKGIHSVEDWHDSTGLILMAACFGGIIVAALWLSSSPEPAPHNPSSSTVSQGLPRALVLAVAAWLVMIEVGTEGWFRAHETTRTRQADWSVNLPDTELQLQIEEFSYQIKSLMRFNQGLQGKWTDADGARWTLMFFRWNQGNARAVNIVKHSPETCLSGAGMKLEKNHGLRTYQVNNLQIPFNAYTFLNSKGRPIQVFYCLWQDRASEDESARLSMDWSLQGRVRRVTHGIRPPSQQVLEIAIVGVDDFDSADSLLQARLPELIVRPSSKR